MNELVSNGETALRLGAFLGVLAAMMVWEVLAPRRARSATRGVRWTANLAIAVLNAAMLRVLFPIAAASTAVWAETRGIGLLNTVAMPAPVALLLAVFVLDLAIYAQHVVFHKVPLLWRLHRMHHADVDFDTTTGVRFHPLEIALSMLYKMAVVVALGAPAIAVIAFEVLLNATAMFNHGNVRLPAGIDRVLRLAVVTPDMHRVHHSVHRDETDSNFGFNLSVWDRMFATYRAQPRDGHEGMTIGLPIFRDPADRRLDKLLVQPFLGN